MTSRTRLAADGHFQFDLPWCCSRSHARRSPGRPPQSERLHPIKNFSMEVNEFQQIMRCCTYVSAVSVMLASHRRLLVLVPAYHQVSTVVTGVDTNDVVSLLLEQLRALMLACGRRASFSAGGQRHGAESWHRILAGEVGWLLLSADQQSGCLGASTVRVVVEAGWLPMAGQVATVLVLIVILVLVVIIPTLKHIFQKNAIKFETRVTSNETRDKKITFTIPYAMLCVSVYLPRYSFKIRGFQSLHPAAKS